MNALSPKTLIQIRSTPFFGHTNLELHVALSHGDGRFSFHKPVEWEICEKDQTTHEAAVPLLNFNTDTAQRLMDELWNLGIRPTEGHGSTGQLAATEKHLDHVSHLLSDAFKTVQNVVNASLVTQHQLPVTPKA